MNPNLTGLYRFAGRNVEITSLYPRVQELCRDYRTDGAPDFCVQTAPEDLAAEAERSAKTDVLEGRKPRKHSDAYLETLAVYRQIAEKMPLYDTVLFHGSCVAVDGAAYLFTASSGTGKSTHTRLWRELLGGRAVMVNDDKPLLRVTERGVLVCGTPWDGKHRLSANIEVPLKALCLLERSPDNRIERIAKRDAWLMLFRQTYRPADPAALTRTLQLIDRLADAAALYRLGCNMDPAAAALSYAAMSGADAP